MFGHVDEILKRAHSIYWSHCTVAVMFVIIIQLNNMIFTINPTDKLIQYTETI